MVEGLKGFEGRLQGVVEIITTHLGIMGRAYVAIALKVLFHLLDAFPFVSLFGSLKMVKRSKALQMSERPDA